MPRSSSLTLSVSEPPNPRLASPSTPATPDVQSSGLKSGTIGRRRESINADTFKPSRLSVIPYSPFSRHRSKSPLFAHKNSSTATLETPKAKDQFDESAYRPVARPQSPSSSLASLSLSAAVDSASLTSGSIHESTSASIFEADEGPSPWTANSIPRAEAKQSGQSKSNKHRFQKLITRTRSGGRAGESESSKSRLDSLPPRADHETFAKITLPEDDFQPSEAQSAWSQSSRQTMASSGASSLRNKSTDRTPNYNHAAEDGQMPPRSHSTKEGGLLSSIKSSGSNAASGLGRAGKGFFDKFTRSANTHNTEQPVEDYNFQVINLPLIEQTRRTRIRSRMEDARDKTEFWMPALPYRCIDYLNLKGVEEEGLYRIPGSGREVKHWQQRFDTELDVNLLDEHDLYDINIIGSMLKSWLRELPDELFPKITQARIAAECAGAEDTPQMMKDELSKLPPFNYYILFAITCHISLLHMNSNKNKMNYHNLCICFQPCMKIDAFCFQFLVCDWKNCWQGCWTEREYLDEEYRILNNITNPTGRSAGSAFNYSDGRAGTMASNSRPGTADGKSRSRERSLASTRGEDHGATDGESGTRLPGSSPSPSPAI